MKYPCQGCERRFVGCHSNCNEYLDCVKRNKEIKQAHKDKKEATNYWNTYEQLKYDRLTSQKQRRTNKY